MRVTGTSAMKNTQSPELPSDYDVNSDLPLLMRRILALASLSVNARFRDVDGLTESQWRLLHHLLLNGPLRVIELARACEIDSAGMTRLIDRLERKGLCRRQRSASDRRVVEVFLTEHGAEDARRFAPVLDGLQADLLASFSEDQKSEMRSLLARMASNALMDAEAARRPA